MFRRSRSTHAQDASTQSSPVDRLARDLEARDPRAYAIAIAVVEMWAKDFGPFVEEVGRAEGRMPTERLLADGFLAARATEAAVKAGPATGEALFNENVEIAKVQGSSGSSSKALVVGLLQIRSLASIYMLKELDQGDAADELRDLFFRFLGSAMQSDGD